MITYNRGDVILVPFPFSNQSATKKRPAVIISSDKYHNVSSDVLIMAITSRIEQNTGIGECFINNWQSAGLLKPSAIKPAISTIEQSLILKRLGSLSSDDLSATANTLKELLSLE